MQKHNRVVKVVAIRINILAITIKTIPISIGNTHAVNQLSQGATLSRKISKEMIEVRTRLNANANASLISLEQISRGNVTDNRTTRRTRMYR